MTSGALVVVSSDEWNEEGEEDGDRKSWVGLMVAFGKVAFSSWASQSSSGWV